MFSDIDWYILIMDKNAVIINNLLDMIGQSV